ncbi:MAG: PDZ domain-containing protein, partial [Prosthecobacter sp.]|nr:PDZ domain-containing protein [Prosthecobacter sp.]
MKVTVVQKVWGRYFAGACIFLSAVTAKAADAPPSLGFQVQPIKGALERVVVTSVQPSSAAATAGVQPGDVLLYGKNPTDERITFADQAAVEAWGVAGSDGQREITVLRGDQIVTLSIVLPAAVTNQIAAAQLL